MWCRIGDVRNVDSLNVPCCSHLIPQCRYRLLYSTCTGGATARVLVALQHVYRWRYSTCTGGATARVQVALQHVYRWRYSTCTGGATARVQVALQHVDSRPKHAITAFSPFTRRYKVTRATDMRWGGGSGGRGAVDGRS